jgi:hypothetical protein
MKTTIITWHEKYGALNEGSLISTFLRTLRNVSIRDDIDRDDTGE